MASSSWKGKEACPTPTRIFASHNGYFGSQFSNIYIYPNPGLSMQPSYVSGRISSLFMYCHEKSIHSFLHSFRERLVDIFFGWGTKENTKSGFFTYRILRKEGMFLLTLASLLAGCDCINSWARVHIPMYTRLAGEFCSYVKNLQLSGCACALGHLWHHSQQWVCVARQLPPGGTRVWKIWALCISKQCLAQM